VLSFGSIPDHIRYIYISVVCLCVGQKENVSSLANVCFVGLIFGFRAQVKECWGEIAIIGHGILRMLCCEL
jgi:hypothetical protein